MTSLRTEQRNTIIIDVPRWLAITVLHNYERPSESARIAYPTDKTDEFLGLLADLMAAAREVGPE